MLIDEFGRKLDDLDMLRYRLMAQQLVGPGLGYSVVAANGTPMTGFIPNPKAPAVELVAFRINERSQYVRETLDAGGADHPSVDRPQARQVHL